MHAGRQTCVAPMPDQEFWQLVGQLGWGTRTTDYKSLERVLMARYTPDQAMAIQAAYDRFSEQLKQRLEQWERSGDGRAFRTGDDGFWDLRAHIIGLGKREFDAVMADPRLAWERANANSYTENFSYSIPRREDYLHLPKKPLTR